MAKKRKSAPRKVYPAKAFTFGELMAEVQKKSIEAESRYRSGMCGANDSKGNPCNRKHTGQDGYCDECRKVINKLLNELSKDSGFFGVNVKF